MVEWLHRGKPSVLGFCSGVVAGLVVVTPACGFVNTNGAMIIGLLAGIIPYFAVAKLKAMFGYDDALDTFGIHGVGGTLGAILTGVLADPSVNSVITPEIKAGLLGSQIKAILVTLILSVVATAVIAFVVKAILGLRPEEEAETIGLDLVEHGEEAYHGA
jgi:Amt family ammonium transporter